MGGAVRPVTTIVVAAILVLMLLLSVGGWCGCHQAGVLPRHFRPWRASKADLPDCWLEPQHSVVLEVKCAEITHSDMFSAGFTLR